MSLHIFISQIGPPDAEVKGSSSSSSSEKVSPETLQGLIQLVRLAQATDWETRRLVQLATAPFKGDGESVGTLRQKMKENFVMTGVKGSREVRQATERVAENKRKEKEGVETEKS